MRVAFFDLDDARDAVTQAQLPDGTWRARGNAEGFASWLFEHRDGITLTEDDGSASAELLAAVHEYQRNTQVTQETASRTQPR